MKAIEFKGHNALMGEAQGYAPLPVMRTFTANGTPMLVSVWKPNKMELEVLVNGGFVMLQVLGTQQPPVKLDVLLDE